jgi:hypothetical protein
MAKTYNKRSITSDGTPSKIGVINTKKSDRKDTANKTSWEKIEEGKVEMQEFHQLAWCAARDKCKNSLRAAATDVKCSGCTHDVHEEFCEKEIIEVNE